MAEEQERGTRAIPVDARNPRQTHFRAGVMDAVPMMAAVIPFSLIFGAASVAAGYSLFETVLTSATVFGGASQFVFIEVNGLGVPAWSVVLAVFAVNFRHILYSASVGRLLDRFGGVRQYLGFFFLTDLQWAATEQRADKKLEVTPAWYFGYALPLYGLWVVMTGVGAFFGAFIDDPARYGFDFLIPIYFLIILIGFRKRTNFFPVLIVSALASYVLFQTVGPPWHISIGALAGIAVAAIIAKRPEQGLLPGDGGKHD